MRTALGLIGYPLAHSFSPAWFADRFLRDGAEGWTYELFPMAEVAELPGLLRSRHDLRGFNVTIPHKQAVLSFLDEMDPLAEQIGAVNTVDIREDGRLVGYNTDGQAFLSTLQQLVGTSFAGRALVLGNGGAALAVQAVLTQLRIPYTVVSRVAAPGRLTYDQVGSREMAAHHLIINTTPLGMTPAVESCPDIPYEEIGSTHFVYDLVYNPEQTLFLNKATKQGATGKNGLEMLYLQAEYSWQIWTRT